MARRTLLVLAAGLISLAMGGCNIFGPILFIAHGPPRVPALYELPRERPTVVLVDDPDNHIGSRQFRLEMAAEIEKRLLAKKKVDTVIESQQLLRVLARERPEDRMAIGEIGRAVGAEVVIWVGVQSFELLQDAESVAPQAQLRIKVLDVVAEEKLWPTETAQHDLVVSMPRQPGAAPDSPSERRRLMMDLARYAGQATAELFYNEERPSSARAGN
ncbi:MAG: hypothetical protein ACF8R7_05840 [Phycisphaerales bacterium JB039]